ncbi:hypothetical protein SynBIOSU31_02991 [Synechococcus sp. BIOS-U3-1]|nr:hypothetical protein SynBIOSU31_02991 [Synechococcus sp. BIOS-U3-1]
MIDLESGGHPSWTSSPSPESIGFTSPIQVVFHAPDSPVWVSSAYSVYWLTSPDRDGLAASDSKNPALGEGVFCLLLKREWC